MNPKTFLAVALSLLTLSLSARSENLGEILERAELGGLIGTWVDENTNGENVTVVYTWRIENHALSMSVKTSQFTSEALIALDPKSGDVVHHSVDSGGGIGNGKWADKDGVATLTLSRVNPEKEESSLTVTLKFADKKLLLGFKNNATDQGGETTLVRKAK